MQNTSGPEQVELAENGLAVAPTRDAVSKGALHISGAKLVLLASGMVLHIVLARMLGVEDYGLYGLLFSLLVWFELFMRGVNKATSMQVAKSPGEARSFQHVALRVQGALSILILSFAIISAFFLPALFDRPGTTNYFILTFLDIPLIGIFYLYQGMLNGLRLYRYQSIAITAYYVSCLAFSVFLVGIGLSITGAMLANILCSLVGWVFSFRFFSIHADKLDRKSSVTFRELFKNSIPFMVLPLIFNVLVSASLWVVGALLSEAELGIYAVSFVFARLLLVLFESLTAALFPALTAAIYVKDLKRSTRLVKQSFRFLLLLIAPACFYLALTAETALKIFGREYTGGSDAVAFLALGFSLVAFLHLMNYIQMANNRFWRVILINFLAVISELICSLILTPRMGLKGAGISLLAAAAFGCILQLILLREQFGLPISFESFCRILAAAGVSAAILIPIKSLWLLIPAYALSALLYILLIDYLGEMDADEIRYWYKMMFK